MADVWFCRIMGIGAVVTAELLPGRTDLQVQSGYVMGLVLICTAMILRNMRERP